MCPQSRWRSACTCRMWLQPRWRVRRTRVREDGASCSESPDAGRSRNRPALIRGSGQRRTGSVQSLRVVADGFDQPAVASLYVAAGPPGCLDRGGAPRPGFAWGPSAHAGRENHRATCADRGPILLQLPFRCFDRIRLKVTLSCARSEDAALSRLKQGFDSPRERQRFQWLKL